MTKMDVGQFLKELGYPVSPGYLPAAEAISDPVAGYSHVFRQAANGPCSLQGVYTLRASWEEGVTPVVPVVYVCKASTEEEADEIHRLVWNQAVVPFLLVHTPLGVKLYSGFRYGRRGEGKERGVLRVLQAFHDIQDIVEDFHAEAIDGGRIWQRFGKEVEPDERVDWNLLRNLRALDDWLRTEGGLRKDVSHALIGKYVYFHYLRDRGILSSRKLAGWGIEESDVFGRDARLDVVENLTKRLETWLNGRIFPIDFGSAGSPSQDHLSFVAGTFSGDEVGERGHRQVSMDFLTYDFSYIPIETLSVIYEQFLHSPETALTEKSQKIQTKNKEKTKTKGKEAGAYYTPLPLVNFILAEMEDQLPFRRGMSVFDPSSGSGSFLVQCYRRLIEKELTRIGRRLRPRELRSLLEEHIFGVDRDPDACSITELSLLLTLLDYVESPDLESTPTFQLPSLRGRNIFQGDFFDDQADWRRKLSHHKFSWIVGNPPWKKLSPEKLRREDQPAWSWMTKTRRDFPIGLHQIAQAFAWRITDFLTEQGQAGILLPAMTLFEDKSRGFRSAFFEKNKVDTVANFSNLAEILFAGRSRVPAAAFFYRLRREDDDPSRETVATYSPLVANQEAARPISTRKRRKSWNLVVNTSEVRNISLEEIANGDGLPWKLATWGSQLDVQLLRRLARQFGTFGSLEEDQILILAQGPELKATYVKDGSNATRICKEVVNKKAISMERLRGFFHILKFPQKALRKNEKKYIRIRGGSKGLTVCRPPHVVVNAGRRFAVYSGQFLIVPPRQVGIASASKDSLFLKALSLYLMSDFSFYHQFLESSQFGVKRDVATLDALRAMPVAIAKLSRGELKEWERLHSRLVKAAPYGISETLGAQAELFEQSSVEGAVLMRELNDMTYSAFALKPHERAQVEDLVRIRLELNDGKLGKAAMRKPGCEELARYGRSLKRELDAFVGKSFKKRHDVSVVYDALSGMVVADLVPIEAAGNKVDILQADEPTAEAFSKTRRRLLQKRSQWVYFNRNLRIYEGTQTFVFKPMQRFHWTESQALFDAHEIIAETLAGGDVC